MQSFLSSLDWRFATKKFDPNRQVSEEHIDQIRKAIQQVPTSFGLQPFHVEIIKDLALREKLKVASFNQSQVTDASHIFVFCARNDISQRITDMIELMSSGNEEVKKSLEPYESMMRGTVEGKDSEQRMNWASRQTYLALAFALAACAELHIDSCPMEGFDAAAVHAILELPDHIQPFAYMTVGYRQEDALHPKFRFPQDDLFTTK